MRAPEAHPRLTDLGFKTSMRVRRCSALLIESRERVEFDFSALSTGESGLKPVIEWIALVPHRDEGVVLNDDEIKVLAKSSAQTWAELEELAKSCERSILNGLIEKGLLIAEAEGGLGGEFRRRDEAIRAMHWRGLDAVVHRHSRWRGVDTVEAQRRFGEETSQSFLERLGTPPPAVKECPDVVKRIELRRGRPAALDSLLERRVTCRNYEPSSHLDSERFGTVLYQAFGARAVDEYAPDIFLLKKGVPSAGSLHPVEAYVLVQRVEGITPGLYHYHPVDHALELLRLLPDGTQSLALKSLGGQPYFAEAHVVVVMAARFRRNFWKYRNHAKAYRAVILDAGHLSQTLYLAATELGLGAFVTAGVNEFDIEEAFGLDPMEDGVIAACGFGIRGPERNEVEFDPLNAVWPAA